MLPPDACLLESLLWTPQEGYFLVQRHLDRLCASAKAFAVPVTSTTAAAALAAVRSAGADDVLLWNEAGVDYTPPLECGLLPGTYRAQLLDEGALRERVLHVSDLERAEGIWLINSVRNRCVIDWVRI